MALAFRPVAGESELDAVFALTHAVYLQEGYCSPCWGGRLMHYPHLDRIPETTVIVAVDEGKVLGTNSWTRDGKAGLHVDADFKPQVDAVREEGRSLASSWRIVTDPACRTRNVVMGLIRRTTRDMVSAGVETCLFTFNPQHERVYKRLLNMQTIARSALIEAVKAPAVLMRLDWERIPDEFMP